MDGKCPIHQTKPEWLRERTGSSACRMPSSDCSITTASQASSSRKSAATRSCAWWGGLEDISMSRAGQSWGIPVPFDPSSVVYVWFDALINYAAAVGYGGDDALFQRWWPANLHIVGRTSRGSTV